MAKFVNYTHVAGEGREVFVRCQFRFREKFNTWSTWTSIFVCSDWTQCRPMALLLRTSTAWYVFAKH